MEKVMVINGSPRAPRSNSKVYAEIFGRFCPCDYFEIDRTSHEKLCLEAEKYSSVVLVFPLYADGLPVTLLNFLKVFEETAKRTKPKISVIVNCGFFEPHQNDISVKMAELFCKETGAEFVSCLKIASGEAILTTPFKFLVVRKLKQLAKAVQNGQKLTLSVTMPISRKFFIKASTKYWTAYGAKYGVSKDAMATMEIEKKR